MKKRDILILLIPSFIFALAWIGFSVYHSFVTSTIPGEVNVSISPITPDFDTKTIESIKQRKSIAPIYQIAANAITTPTPEANTIIPTPAISSSSAQQATPEGNLSQ